jgi:hypothetical protein
MQGGLKPIAHFVFGDQGDPLPSRASRIDFPHRVRELAAVPCRDPRARAAHDERASSNEIVESASVHGQRREPASQCDEHRRPKALDQ